MENLNIIGITPFEKPDLEMALAIQKAGAFPVLHLGYSEKEALVAMEKMNELSEGDFGVCFPESGIGKIPLPNKVGMVILPVSRKEFHYKNRKIFFQVRNLKEAVLALTKKPSGIIIKGNEASGAVGDESSFILFQQIKKEIDFPVWVQGGIGLHTSAALFAAGAKGVVLDSQFALFPPCNLPPDLKEIVKRSDGTETKLIGNFRVLVYPKSPPLPENAGINELLPFLGGLNVEKNYIPAGQDIGFAKIFYEKFKTLGNFIFGLREAIEGHIRQAKSTGTIVPGNLLAQDLKIKYPIAKGPMSSVSDVPQFIDAVATGGALPFFALSLLNGEIAKDLLTETKKLLDGKTWGVGVIGFAPKEIREEQFRLIEEIKPPVVLIAGGRPSQAKELEKSGIKTFLHVPSVTLLDQYLKEGAKCFIFEGRECGGHIGPLSSFVLWEQQINRLLSEDSEKPIYIFFAGGIHNALSSVLVSVMAAPLAAKGIRTGILMGTAYLFTKEAVETGAILKQFQELAVSGGKTAVLESSPGHETRGLITPYISYFESEKKRLTELGIPKKEIWAELENLNSGRLRIAAKGISLRDGNSEKVDSKKQLENGMYMIGQAAGLRKEITSVDKLHHEVAVENNEIIKAVRDPVFSKKENHAKPLNIAVIGMACIFPDAKNIDEFWKNIVTGKDSITEVPDERWNKKLYFDADSVNGEKTPSKWGGFIPAIDFDPLEFGIPPQSLAAIDPTQLLSLLVARKALEDSGYHKRDFDRDNTSVIFGVEGGTDLAHGYTFRALFPQYLGKIPDELDKVLPRLTEDSFPGILGNVVSGRVANRLDFGGRNYIVDAACASSISALDVACQELAMNKSDMVLAGGADLHNTIGDYLLFSSAHAVSKKGRCKTFDTGADGMSLGEGIAVVVLKRLEDAKRDGDRIYCAIEGVGGSSDGKSLGLTAPRKEGQIKAIQRAYNQAGISPSAVGLMEAHGTGTVVGDRTELSSMTDVFIQSGALINQTALGSVKTQIGHTKCAAGMAGFIKIVLSAYHGVKPPTINLSEPNHFYNSALSPFVFNTEAGIWSEKERIAGVSAFGFGGTNFHAVLKSDHAPVDYVLKSWPSELLVFRGKDQQEGFDKIRKVKQLIELNDSLEIKDIAFSLATGSNEKIQISIVAGDLDDLKKKIAAALNSDFSDGVFQNKDLIGKIAFLFAGQGSQRINMARDLFTLIPSIRKHLPAEYEKILFPETVFKEELKKLQSEKIKNTGNAQPLLGIVDYAIASFLKELGIHADMAAGHSYGEIPALCFAGVFEEKHLAFISRKRAAAILSAAGEDKGGMIAFSGNKEELSEIMNGENEVWPVNFNSPAQLVIAGTTPGIARAAEKLKKEKKSFRQLEVACAFHSPLLKQSEKLFEKTLKEIPFSTPSIPVWSNTSATEYPKNEKEIKRRMAEHLVKPVLFSQQVQKMYEDGARVFIEVGPGNILTQLVKANLGKDELLLTTEQKGKTGISHLLNNLAKYISSGREIDFQRLFDGRDARVIDIENPEKHKKNNSVWKVSGHRAVPLTGKLPGTGMSLVSEPLKISGSNIEFPNGSGNNAEHLVQEYLNNIKAIVHSQRDIMLTYLGKNPSDFIIPGIKGALPAGQISGQPQLQKPSEENGSASPDLFSSVLKQTPESLKNILLETVSEKTGYPKEMLGMDMDLEADLSIDSIKRTEIIGNLKAKLGGLKNSGKSEEEIMEQLTSIKTLNGLVSWLIQSIREGGTSDNISSSPEVIPPEKKKNETRSLIRFKFEMMPKNLEKSLSPEIKNKVFALSGKKNPIASELKVILENAGIKAQLVSSEDSLKEYDGLIYFENELTEKSSQKSILDFFSTVKSLDPGKVKLIFAVPCLSSHLVSPQNLKPFKNSAGYTGFLNSLGKEWEKTVCKTIHLDPSISPVKNAGILFSEALSSPDFCEVYYEGEKRLVPEKTETPFPKGKNGLVLEGDSVILVLGGAQGITAESVIAFSKEFPCKYILTGRTVFEPKSIPEGCELLKEKSEIRKWLLSSEKFESPKELEKKADKIYKQTQIQNALKNLKANGAIPDYHAIDLRNENEFSRFLKDLYKKYEKIDGIIHGAGLLDDKFFENKTLESFERVYSTKVTPLNVIAENLKGDIKFLVFFSSIASVMGNRGQVDYAAANSVLDSCAHALKNKIEGRVVSINWGPWSGKGMISPELEKNLKSRGIISIQLEEGTAAFVNELKYGTENQVVIMGR